ncbi:hypothetical protein FHS18_001162 [Paenibacillus phyllosphaerae]|uniref:Uncharacterized protein n=1 Tax=Paenibacillus phyllosphaerae TaxID=274593 RepID=A0A7W5AUN7_9BACL|nr:hypothetical protein [Paenibacillus phyllosphaerae]MBB3109110.1 hypothetical protein [Paenibacillus phyllosphaerae]
MDEVFDKDRKVEASMQLMKEFESKMMEFIEEMNARLDGMEKKIDSKVKKIHREIDDLRDLILRSPVKRYRIDPRRQFLEFKLINGRWRLPSDISIDEPNIKRLPEGGLREEG